MKRYVKRCLKQLALVLATPLYLLHRLISVITGHRDSSFQSCSQLLSLIPGKAGVYLRGAFYRLACPGTSDEICIGFLTVLSHWDTTIEPGVYIGPQCNIGKCSIGANTLLGSGVHVLSGNRQHHFDDPTRPIQEQGGKFEKIRIGTDCWLGNGSVTLCDIGDHSIVAAGSIVTKKVDKFMIVAGNPAEALKQRPHQPKAHNLEKKHGH